MKKMKVTMIVPVYCCEEWIGQCIESILAQTYENIELILVDDGSTDHSGEICDRYANIDNRIRVFHKDNGGANSSRLYGLKRAKGQYVMFVDGDDWLDPDTIERCLEYALSKKMDCILFSYMKEYTGKSIQNRIFEHNFFYDVEKSEKYIHQRLVGASGEAMRHPHRIDNLSSMCMKLYKTETARKGKFVSEKTVGTSEDTLFNLYALENCRIGYLNQCFYHYRRMNSESITTHYKQELSNKWDNMYRIFWKYVKDSGRKEDYTPLFFNRVACGMIGLGINEVSSGKNIVQQMNQIRQILNKPLYRKAFKQLDISPCPIQWKVFFILCKMRMSFLLTVLLRVIRYLRGKVEV